MRGLNLFSAHQRQNALEQEARANLAAREVEKADSVLTAQLVKLQALTPSAALIAAASAPAPVAPVVKKAAPKVATVDYGKVAIAGGVVLGFVTWAIMRKRR